VASALVKDLSGNATRMSPRWSMNLAPTYDIALGNGGRVQLGANAAYKSTQYHTEFNDPRMAQKGYALFDANILYTAPGDRLTANFWVKNLTDKFVYAGSFAVSTSRAIGGTFLPPRTYGVTVGYKF
jgi:iron complex outermembrane receptor protein